MRGVHRRHRPLRGGRGAGGGHLRHGPGRGAREAAPRLRRRGWCWPSTPTAPASRPPAGSTSGSAGSRSTWPWPPCRRGPTPATWPGPTPTALRAAVEGAKPFLHFRVERILDAADLSTPEGRAKAADTALAAVAEHPDNLVRDQYLMQVAERCRLEPAAPAGPARAAPQGGAAEGSRRGARPRPPRPRRRDRAVRRPATGVSSGSGSPTTALGRRRLRRRGGRRSGRPAARTGRRADRPSGTGVPARARGAPPGHPPARGRRPPAGGRPVPRRPPAGGLPGPGRRRPDADSTRPSTRPHREVRALLVRLTVEEPMGEPDDVVLQLVRDAARGELHRDHGRGPDVARGGRGGGGGGRLGPGAGRSGRLGRGDGEVGSLARGEGTEGHSGAGLVTADQGSPVGIGRTEAGRGIALRAGDGRARRRRRRSRPTSSRR